MSAWITLSPKDIAVADEVGTRRRQAAIIRNRTQKNNRTDDAKTLLQTDIEGARCEKAGQLCFAPVEWHSQLVDDPRGLPDLDDFIDVKGTSYPAGRLIVQRDNNKDWAYLLVRSHKHPVYEIVGWMWGHQAQLEEHIMELEPGRPAHCIGGKILNPLSELYEELRIRQAFR